MTAIESLVFLLIGNYFMAIQGEESCTPPSGKHCNYTGSVNDLQQCQPLADGNFMVQDEVIKCVSCYNSHHCLEDNVCLTGTTGPTCERCITPADSGHQGYYHSGRSCVRCSVFPWPVLGLLILIMASVPVIVKNGFSLSVYVKFKQLLDFLQYLCLTSNVRQVLPKWMAPIFSSFSFSYFNTLMITPECYNTPFYSHYLEWLSSLVLPAAAYILWRTSDSWMRRKSQQLGSCEHRARLWRRRVYLRRVGFLFLLMWYTPMAISTLHSQACANTIPKVLVMESEMDPFLYDQQKSCNDFLFQTLSFVLVIYFVCIVVCGPVLLLFTALRYHKWNMLQAKAPYHGSLYSQYRQQFCFWETIPLIRKLAYVSITEIFPFGATVESSLMLTLTLIYALLTAIFRPYKKYWWPHFKWININNAFEVVSSVTVSVVQLCCMLRDVLQEMYPTPLDSVCVALVFLTIVTWFAVFIFIHKETTLDEVEEYHMAEDEDSEESCSLQENDQQDMGEAQDLETRAKALNF